MTAIAIVSLTILLGALFSEFDIGQTAFASDQGS